MQEFVNLKKYSSEKMNLYYDTINSDPKITQQINQSLYLSHLIKKTVYGHIKIQIDSNNSEDLSFEQNSIQALKILNQNLRQIHSLVKIYALHRRDKQRPNNIDLNEVRIIKSAIIVDEISTILTNFDLNQFDSDCRHQLDFANLTSMFEHLSENIFTYNTSNKELQLTLRQMERKIKIQKEKQSAENRKIQSSDSFLKTNSIINEKYNEGLVEKLKKTINQLENRIKQYQLILQKNENEFIQYITKYNNYIQNLKQIIFNIQYNNRFLNKVLMQKLDINSDWNSTKDLHSTKYGKQKKLHKTQSESIL